MSHATATKTAAKKPAKKKVSAFSTRKVDPAYYWMVVPAAIIFAFFLYLPFLDGIKYSFTNSQGYGDYKFIGLKNYIALFQDNRVGHAYLFTFLIAILITVLINVIALFLSVLLNSKIAFKNGFRAVFFIPYTLSVLVIGYVFKYIFMNPLPELGKALGIGWFVFLWGLNLPALLAGRVEQHGPGHGQQVAAVGAGAGQAGRAKGLGNQLAGHAVGSHHAAIGVQRQQAVAFAAQRAARPVQAQQQGVGQLQQQRVFHGAGRPGHQVAQLGPLGVAGQGLCLGGWRRRVICY